MAIDEAVVCSGSGCKAGLVVSAITSYEDQKPDGTYGVVLTAEKRVVCRGVTAVEGLQPDGSITPRADGTYGLSFFDGRAVQTIRRPMGTLIPQNGESVTIAKTNFTLRLPLAVLPPNVGGPILQGNVDMVLCYSSGPDHVFTCPSCGGRASVRFDANAQVARAPVRALGAGATPVPQGAPGAIPVERFDSVGYKPGPNEFREEN